MFGSRDLFVYFECAACGCLQIRGIPGDIAKYYPSNYFSFGRRRWAITYRLRDIIKKIRDSHTFGQRNIPGQLLSYLFPDATLSLLAKMNPGRESRILDVGCGSDASILRSLKNMGFENILGVDPYLAKDIKEKNGLEIRKTSIEALDGKWDLIMFHHSFEHLVDPHSTLKAAGRLLSSRGLCLIGIPIVSSLAWKRYGTNWVQLDPPRHIYLHSLESMNILSSQAGFEITKVEFDSNELQFWASEQYARDIPLCAGSLVARREMVAFRKEAASLNATRQGDQAAFFLRKIDIDAKVAV